ncbi:MAG: class I SAM-dependent methyltransferase [Firmicutes bacterium]|nr:class I SAM-dependent methyltransferase [Bacillota bacterium]
MGEHYFTESPTSAHAEKEIAVELRGRRFQFVTDAGVFARGKLDRGTRLLIEAVDIPEGSVVLDLGCGYGPIGIAAAVLCPTCRVYMIDVNERACGLTRRNAALNGAANVEVRCGTGFQPVKGMKFDLVLSNPPIRAGKRVLFEIIEEAAQHLKPGGRLVLVAQTKQGAKSLLRKLAEVFPTAREVEKGGGYRVMEGVAGIAGEDTTHGSAGP